MRTRTEISKYVCTLLARQKKPKNMQWITEQACIKFQGIYNRKDNPKFHRQIWNAVWGSCFSPFEKPRLRKTVIAGVSYFEVNK